MNHELLNDPHDHVNPYRHCIFHQVWAQHEGKVVDMIHSPSPKWSRGSPEIPGAGEEKQSKDGEFLVNDMLLTVVSPTEDSTI